MKTTMWFVRLVLIVATGLFIVRGGIRMLVRPLPEELPLLALVLGAAILVAATLLFIKLLRWKV